MTVKNMMGVRFGKLIVASRAGNSKDGTARWACVCDCGEWRVIAGTALRAGRHKSCGCSSPRFTSERAATHGQSNTRTYKIWLGMQARCNDANGKKSHLYFGKGITVCQRWEKFDNFLADMGEAPYKKSIDRINGNSGYEPGNCRWATATEQANNMSTNHLVTFGCRTMTVSMWAREIGVAPNTLLYRLRRGIPTDVAMQPSIGNKLQKAKQLRQRACAVCGTMFVPRMTQLRSGGGKFCSQKCNGASRMLDAK